MPIGRRAFASFADADEPVGFREGQRLQQDARDDRRERCRRADANGERADRGQGERRTSQQRAKAIARVRADRVELRLTPPEPEHMGRGADDQGRQPRRGRGLDFGGPFAQPLVSLPGRRQSAQESQERDEPHALRRHRPPALSGATVGARSRSSLNRSRPSLKARLPAARSS